MAKSNSPSPSEEGANTSSEVRRRVTKACQRCRLKKCKVGRTAPWRCVSKEDDCSQSRQCDGSAPCGRCMADDAICAYGRHKKSDKTVYRKGYVQMLERQHSQLIAGVHEMFRIGQQSSNWPNALRTLAYQNKGQPLTHQILEALGVLQSSPQEEAEDPDGEWQTFEHHPQDDGEINDSSTPSPTLNSRILGALETTKEPFVPYQSTDSQQRYPEFDRDDLVNMEFNSSIPSNLFNLQSNQIPSFNANMAYSVPQQQQQLPDPFSEQQAYQENLGMFSNPAMTVGWTGMEDMFDSTASHMQPAKSG